MEESAWGIKLKEERGAHTYDDNYDGHTYDDNYDDR